MNNILHGNSNQRIICLHPGTNPENKDKNSNVFSFVPMTIRNSLDIFTKTLNIYFASLSKQNTIKVQTGHFLSQRE